MDRAVEEEAGRFGERIASLDADVVIDLTCYQLQSAEQLVEALRGNTGHLLHCGTIWVHGPSVEVPTTEAEPRRAFGDYGERKAAIEAYLLRQAHRSALPVTILHPGHLVGPGWAPVNPAGNFNPEIFSKLLQGSPIQLPNIGMETLHHVHADDVAQCFRTSHRAQERCYWRELSRRIARGADSAGICGARERMVRTHRSVGIFALGRVAAESDGKGRRGDLGPHCALAELQHCQSTHAIGI